ncbi:hypothetical protein ON010_g7870 [Phytophthora cinnamomi]|nr:hypothetical protein ON010_g7870 [Phytophthora cinnamomi]
MSGLQHDEITNNNGLGLTPVNHGVVPRSIKRLFAEIEREKRGAAGSSFSVYCSFIEIYNEKIYDILSPEVPTNGKGNQSPDTKTTAATTGSLTQRARWNSTVSGKESRSLQIRQKLDGSVFVDGMTSRNVINDVELLEAFREPCLQGSGRTAFIVTISPSKGSLEESFATLRFAERLKAIRCRPIRRSLFSNEMLGEQRLYYERQIQAMRAEVNRLRELLRKANQRPSEPAGSSSRDANAALVEENRRLKELLLQSERSRIVERNERITNKSGKTNVSGSVRMSPQQFSARQMLKPTSIQDEESSISASARKLRHDTQVNNSTEEPIERTTNMLTKASDQPRDQLTTLENQLQSKEARLNWMLEAEMEAQNAGTGTPIAKDAVSADPNHRTTVTRSWAVETRLRRQLVGIPPPLREAQSDPGSGPGRERDIAANATASQRESVPVKRVLPALVESTPSPPRVDSAFDPSTSEPTPRNPVRCQAPSPPTETNVQTDHASTGRRRSRADTFAKSHQAGRSESTASNAQPEKVKAASILKLVGSGASERFGKTREELVEEYKRARRVELEAMMRTMVQK